MLTSLRLHWAAVDDLQWSVLRDLLNTDRLAPDGCLSWHSRRTGEELHVNALWDDRHAAELFLGRRLGEALAAAELAPPVVEHKPMPGLFALGSRPRRPAEPASAVVVHLPVPVPHVPQQRRAG